MEISVAQSSDLLPSVEANDVLEIRENRVVERIRELSQCFTVRQVASIHQMSITFLQGFAEKHGIQFQINGGTRTKRISSERIAREKLHTQATAARSVTRRVVSTLDSSKITPELRELARRRDQERTNSFIEMLREYGKTHTKAETAKIVNISPDFLRQISYQREIKFLGDSARTDHMNLAKIKRTLFRPRSVSPATSELLRHYIVSDVEDEV